MGCSSQSLDAAVPLRRGPGATTDEPGEHRMSATRHAARRRARRGGCAMASPEPASTWGARSATVLRPSLTSPSPPMPPQARTTATTTAAPAAKNRICVDSMRTNTDPLTLRSEASRQELAERLRLVPELGESGVDADLDAPPPPAEPLTRAAVEAARTALLHGMHRTRHPVAAAVRTSSDAVGRDPADHRAATRRPGTILRHLSEGLARKAHARDLLVATIEAARSAGRPESSALPIEEDDACCKECPVCLIRSAARRGLRQTPAGRELVSAGASILGDTGAA